MLNSILWGPDPFIFEAGGFRVAWYGLLFASGLLIGYQILKNIYSRENIDEKNLDALTIYMVVGTVVGARLGHVFFYEAESYLNNPIEIFKIWKGGLASHGAGVGILTACFLYVKKYKPKSYWWVMDRVCIGVALAALLIRTGNFVNSEIIGQPYDGATSVVFTHNDESRIMRFTPVVGVDFKESGKLTKHEGLNLPVIDVTVELDKRLLKTEGKSPEAIFASMHSYLASTAEPNADGSVGHEFKHIIMMDKSAFDVNTQAESTLLTFQVIGVSRHPAQLYEGLSSFVLFVILMFLYYKRQAGEQDGVLFGIFLIWIFALRFFYEFLKENQVVKENDMDLNMGQWLSIPLVLLGAYLLIRAIGAKSKNRT